MTTYKEINGRNFKVCKPITEEQFERQYHTSNLDLDDCYGRPSIYKRNIWNSWCLFFAHNEGFRTWGIESYNLHMFTISGTYVEDGRRYTFYITKTRQELYPVV